MDCRQVKTLLASYMEGEVSSKQREGLQAHLEACQHCRKEKELFSKSWDLLDDYAAPELSADFTRSLMRKIYSQQLERQRAASNGLPRFILRPIVPVLTSFLVVVLTFTIFWKRPASTGSLSTATHAGSTAAITADEDIIKDLDIIENLDLLENVKLLTELDIIEELNGST